MRWWRDNLKLRYSPDLEVWCLEKLPQYDGYIEKTSCMKVLRLYMSTISPYLCLLLIHVYLCSMRESHYFILSKGIRECRLIPRREIPLKKKSPLWEYVPNRRPIMRIFSQKKTLSWVYFPKKKTHYENISTWELEFTIFPERDIPNINNKEPE